jgi:hypothetical protein
LVGAVGNPVVVGVAERTDVAPVERRKLDGLVGEKLDLIGKHLSDVRRTRHVEVDDSVGCDDRSRKRFGNIHDTSAERNEKKVRSAASAGGESPSKVGGARVVHDDSASALVQMDGRTRFGVE